MSKKEWQELLSHLKLISPSIASALLYATFNIHGPHFHHQHHNLIIIIIISSSSWLSHHHHYQHPYYHLVLPRHSTLHSIFMDLSLEKDIIFSLNTNVKCFTNLQHVFTNNITSGCFRHGRGISYLDSENKAMSKLQWFSHTFATKNVVAQRNIYARQTTLIEIFGYCYNYSNNINSRPCNRCIQ